MSHDVGPGTPTSVGCIACRRVATLIRAPPRWTGAGPVAAATQPRPRDAGPQHQPEAEHQVLDRCVEQAAVAEDRDPPAADDRVTGVAHDAATGQPAVGEELEEHDDRVGGPPVAGRGQPRADDPAVQHDGDRHAEEGDGGVGHVRLTSRPRGTAEPGSYAAPGRADALERQHRHDRDHHEEADLLERQARDAPRQRLVRVEPPVPDVRGPEVPQQERRPGEADGEEQASGLLAAPAAGRRAPAAASRRGRTPAWRRTPSGEGSWGAHACTGRLERSPLRRFSTSSALIRHIGRPTPGTVLAPA